MKTKRLLPISLISGALLILLGSFTFCQPVKAPSDEVITKVAVVDSLDLAKYKGKVVVLHFWASWSKSSRAENKNVVRVYQKYKQNPNIVFISVSLDTDRTNWKNAIEEDELSWPEQICDFKKYESPIALKYKVSTLPSMMLVDKKGHIGASSARMIDIENTIDGLLK
jgi:thiol-disulfide isomerase/thioredoxin